MLPVPLTRAKLLLPVPLTRVKPTLLPVPLMRAKPMLLPVPLTRVMPLLLTAAAVAAPAVAAAGPRHTLLVPLRLKLPPPLWLLLSSAGGLGGVAVGR